MNKLTSAEWSNRADAFYEASGKLRQGAATIGGFAADPVSAVKLAADLIDALAATAEDGRREARKSEIASGKVCSQCGGTSASPGCQRNPLDGSAGHSFGGGCTPAVDAPAPSGVVA